MIEPPKIIVIKSEVSELKLIETFLSELFNEYGLRRENFNRVFLCVSEAVINAIEHGNNNEKNKTVSIGIDYKEGVMDVYIKDQGEGFNLENVQNPTLKENIQKESGRGIHIIKSLSNGISFNNKGNFIQIKIVCE